MRQLTAWDFLFYVTPLRCHFTQKCSKDVPRL